LASLSRKQSTHSRARKETLKGSAAYLDLLSTTVASPSIEISQFVTRRC